MTQGGCTLELQTVFVTAENEELSGLVSNWTVADENPVVEKVTRHETHGANEEEFAWLSPPPVAVNV
jgi:hypothetical protein